MNWKDFFKGKEEEKKTEPKVEDKLFNPLKAYCGSFIELETLEARKSFTVTEVLEYFRHLAGDDFLFTDYRLKDEDDVIYHLRVVPKESYRENESIINCDVLLLNLFYEGEFDDGVIDAAQCEEFNDDRGEERVVYYALAEKDGYKTRIRTAKIKDLFLHDRGIRYWDFRRDPNPKFGELFSDDVFLFVECSDVDGYITMWQGTYLLNKKIDVFNTER